MKANVSMICNSLLDDFSIRVINFISVLQDIPTLVLSNNIQSQPDGKNR
jgi:hypothetical protein